MGPGSSPAQRQIQFVDYRSEPPELRPFPKGPLNSVEQPESEAGATIPDALLALAGPHRCHIQVADIPDQQAVGRIGVDDLVRAAAEQIAFVGVLRSMLGQRSEEHTSELQSLMRISYAVFCLKKKKNTQKNNTNIDLTQNNIIAPQQS